MCLLYLRCCFKSLTHLVLFWPPFYKWRNWSTGRLSSLPTVRQVWVTEAELLIESRHSGSRGHILHPWAHYQVQNSNIHTFSPDLFSVLWWKMCSLWKPYHTNSECIILLFVWCKKKIVIFNIYTFTSG